MLVVGCFVLYWLSVVLLDLSMPVLDGKLFFVMLCYWSEVLIS